MSLSRPVRAVARLPQLRPADLPRDDRGLRRSLRARRSTPRRCAPGPSSGRRRAARGRDAWRSSSCGTSPVSWGRRCDRWRSRTEQASFAADRAGELRCGVRSLPLLSLRAARVPRDWRRRLSIRRTSAPTLPAISGVRRRLAWRRPMRRTAGDGVGSISLRESMTTLFQRLLLEMQAGGFSREQYDELAASYLRRVLDPFRSAGDGFTRDECENAVTEATAFLEEVPEPDGALSSRSSGIGSTGVAPMRSSKWSCGRLTEPVMPIEPILSPRETLAPFATRDVLEVGVGRDVAVGVADEDEVAVALDARADIDDGAVLGGADRGAFRRLDVDAGALAGREVDDDLAADRPAELLRRRAGAAGRRRPGSRSAGPGRHRRRARCR